MYLHAIVPTICALSAEYKIKLVSNGLYVAKDIVVKGVIMPGVASEREADKFEIRDVSNDGNERILVVSDDSLIEIAWDFPRGVQNLIYFQKTDANTQRFTFNVVDLDNQYYHIKTKGSCVEYDPSGNYFVKSTKCRVDNPNQQFQFVKVDSYEDLKPSLFH